MRAAPPFVRHAFFAFLALAVLSAPLAGAVGPTPAGAIRLFPAQDEIGLERGELATIKVGIRNDYPFTEEVVVRLTMSSLHDWAGSVTPSNVTLEPGASTNVTLLLHRAGNATAGDGAVTISAEGTPFPGDASARINLTALETVPKPPANDPGAFRVELSGPGAPVEARTPQPARIPFRITNAGDVGLTASVDASAPPGWITKAKSTNVSLAPGRTELLHVEATPPADAEGTHVVDLVVRAFSFDGRSLSEKASAEVRILPPATGEPEPAGEPSASPAPAREEAGPGPEPRPTADAPPGETPAENSPPMRDPLLEIEVAVVRVPASGAGATRVVARNPGTTPLAVPLTVEAPAGWKARLEPSDLVVRPGEEGVAWLHVEPEHDGAEAGIAVVKSDRAAARVTVAIADAGGFEAADADHLATLAQPFTAAPPSPIPPLIAILAVALAGAAMHRYIGDGDRRWRLAAALAALYTRTPPARMLEHPKRARLFSLVAAEPGLHFNEIKRRAGLQTGALIHHLARLERHGIVTSRQDGNKRRFYAMGDAPERPTTSPGGTRAEILRALERAGGSIDRPDLAASLACSRQLLHYHLRSLAAGGLVEVDPRGRITRTPVLAATD